MLWKEVSAVGLGRAERGRGERRTAAMADDAEVPPPLPQDGEVSGLADAEAPEQAPPAEQAPADGGQDATAEPAAEDAREYQCELKNESGQTCGARFLRHRDLLTHMR
ncbi:MAG: hypothetical protein ACPIOQ_66620, partial [Promethearchaeia archaeon]